MTNGESCLEAFLNSSSQVIHDLPRLSETAVKPSDQKGSRPPDLIGSSLLAPGPSSVGSRIHRRKRGISGYFVMQHRFVLQGTGASCSFSWCTMSWLCIIGNITLILGLRTPSQEKSQASDEGQVPDEQVQALAAPVNPPHTDDNSIFRRASTYS